MKKIIICISILSIITSCEIVDVLDNDPPNSLVFENVVKNEEDAKVFHNGIYGLITASGFGNEYYYMYTEVIPSAMAGTMSPTGGSDIGQISTNDISYENSFVSSFWLFFYKIINAANNSIALTSQLSEDQIKTSTKDEIIGDAHFLRAMVTFDALRYFGQFFDRSSNLGVVLRTEPANYVTRDKPRSTVEETYSQILSDIEVALQKAPDYSVSYKGSKTAARALKAKVLLYQGEYAKAAAVADEIIKGGFVSLENTFQEAFDKGLESSEMILMTYRDEKSDEVGNIKKFYPGRVGSDGWFIDLMKDDPRQPFTYSDDKVLKTNNVKVYRPTYFMRLAEMYLIKAEGLAFSDASLDDVRAPLDIIRNRAGIGKSSAVTREALKDDIFNEIVRELAFENGSEWFAAIRFNKIMALKPTVTSSNQYILPIPEEEIKGNRFITLSNQNPGYE